MPLEPVAREQHQAGKGDGLDEIEASLGAVNCACSFNAL